MNSSTPDSQLEEISRKVVAHAAKAKIVLTPEAYWVWHAYYAGVDEKLTAAVAAHQASGKAFSVAVHQRLFGKYLGRHRGQDLIAQVHEETQQVIKNIFNELLLANRHTSSFGDRLDGYAQQLKKSTDIGEMEELMAAMLADTTEMAAAGRTLENKLKEATAQTEKLKAQLARTEREANVDALTGLHNRQALDKRIMELVQEFKQHKRVFSALFVDIDFFKKFNDTYGHKVGDLVLQTVGRILHKGVKGSDFPSRYGGEEFVVLLPETTLDNAKIVAEQLRVLISVKKPKDPATGEVYEKITASLGVSQVKAGDTPAKVLERADKALYLAKKSGRNQVRTEEEL